MFFANQIHQNYKKKHSPSVQANIYRNNAFDRNFINLTRPQEYQGVTRKENKSLGQKLVCQLGRKGSKTSCAHILLRNPKSA
jgi:hypothetical protein